MKKIITFLELNWFKIVISLAFLVLAVGISLYLRSLNNLAAQNLVNNKSEQLRDYAMKQKQNCLDIYQAESKKYNNVTSWNYDIVYDKCEITYKDDNPKTIDECAKTYHESIGFAELFADSTSTATMETKSEATTDYTACVNGDFINRF